MYIMYDFSLTRKQIGESCYCGYNVHVVGGSKGGGGARDIPHLGLISFIFMQFSANILSNNRYSS